MRGRSSFEGCAAGPWGSLALWGVLLVLVGRCREAAAIFLDFEAAFPSVSQEFILASLRHMGLPEDAVRAYAALYFQNRCKLRLQGGLFDGSAMTSGVRQGCLISPLIKS